MPTSSTPPTFYTLPGGGRLRGDAAASLLRTRADGMPAGGIDVYSRSLEKQRLLYAAYKAGRGPLAAPPDPNAPHVRGCAIDLQTTRGGVYTPSAAHRWLTAGGDGASKPKAGEKLRAHTYGWYRTARPERWHFTYDPARDTRAKADLAVRLQALGFPDVQAFQRAKKLAVDGVAGPQTWTALLLAADAAPKPGPPVDPPEVPVPVDPKPPVEPVTAVLNLGVANCQSYDGDNSERAYRARARIMASKGWTVIALCETTESGRKWLMDELYKATGHRWAVWTLASKSVALIWDDRIWSPGNRRTVSFGTAFGHGAVLVPLTHRATKLGVDVMSVHVRPKSVATPAQKATDVAKAAKLAKGWPCVFAGDFALDAPKLPGWIRATPVVDTVKSDGGANSRVDAAFIRGRVGAGKAIVVDPGPLSDHKWLGVHLILGGSTS